MEASDEAQPMRDDLSPKQYWKFVDLWHREGEGNGRVPIKADESDSESGDIMSEIGCVQMIGGCCGIGPGHISLLKEKLSKKK